STNGLTNATATTATATATTATATATTATATATTSTATTSTATTSGDLPGVLPKNVIFYDQYNGDNREFRYISPNGTGDSLYFTLPPLFDSFAPNPVKENQYFFAARSSDTARAGIYRNSRISLSGATEIVGPTYGLGVYGMQVSNDGKYLVYTATVNEELPRMFVVNLQAPTAPPVVIDQADRFHISPDVRKVVYSKLVGGTGDDIFVRDFPTGANMVNLTNDPEADDNYPQFTVDNKKIVFSSDRGTRTDYDLYSILVGGGSLTRLTNTPDEFEIGATFSPTGAEVAYSLLTGTQVGNGLYRKGIADDATRVLVKEAEGINETRWTGSNGKANTTGVNVGLNARKKKQAQ
ncbi:hypothetical protein EON81_22680, partial [bacterium]